MIFFICFRDKFGDISEIYLTLYKQNYKNTKIFYAITNNLDCSRIVIYINQKVRIHENTSYTATAQTWFFNTSNKITFRRMTQCIYSSTWYFTIDGFFPSSKQSVKNISKKNRYFIFSVTSKLNILCFRIIKLSIEHEISNLYIPFGSILKNEKNI